MSSVNHVEGDMILVVGYGKLPQGTSAEQLHKVLALGVLVDRDTGIVADASSTLAARTADEFVRNALVGRNLVTGAADLIDYLGTHYHGMAQKAVIAAFRDLVRRFTEATEPAGS